MQQRIQGNRHQFEPLSYKVIGACIDVQRQLGTHCIALPKYGVQFEREVHIPIVYDGVTVTQRRVDFKCWDDQDLFVNTPTFQGEAV